VDLPFRDLDHRAMCRHAAGILLARGHRRLALILPKTRLAGDIESEAGFAEGVEQSGHTDAAAIFCRHDATAPGIAQALRRLFEQDAPPTGLLVVNPNHYLTVASRLGQLGRAVPRDISIISRDEDPFLSFVWPRPACYLASPPALAKSLLRPVLELLEGGVVSQRAVRLMPKFSPGETVGAAPA
jgi:LacI family transcriptional regulator